MLGVLLESKAVRQRRDGGAALSVATHLAIVGLVAAVTAKPPAHREREQPVRVTFAPTVQRQLPPRPVEPTIRRVGGLSSAPTLPILKGIPPTLPPIEFGASPDPSQTEIKFGEGRRGVGELGGIDLGDGDRGAGGGSDWTGTETMMRLLVSAKPRYPERLRLAGVNGQVRIRFVVDTTGRVDPTSVQILESTHDLFTTAVREILPVLRFKPSEANGQRVKSPAEMAFEFQITR